VVSDGRTSLRRIALGKRSDLIAQAVAGVSAGEGASLHPADPIAKCSHVAMPPPP
jgi:hypothetical protein